MLYLLRIIKAKVVQYNMKTFFFPESFFVELNACIFIVRG